MTLVDAGPLVALCDEADEHHDKCFDEALRLPVAPMLTTWPCFTEAMHLLGREGGFPFQEKRWQLHFKRKLLLHELSRQERLRCFELMEKYRDLPMDFADASLIAVAETRSLRKVFTIDRQLRIYRLEGGQSLEVVP
jgi:hypothetical protein